MKLKKLTDLKVGDRFIYVKGNIITVEYIEQLHPEVLLVKGTGCKYETFLLHEDDLKYIDIIPRSRRIINT